MSSSLRDLMRREKESRKRTSTETTDSNKQKIQKTSQPEYDKVKDDGKPTFSASTNPKPEHKVAESLKLPADFFDEPTQHTHNSASSLDYGVDGTSEQLEFKAPAPLNLNRDAQPNPQFNPALLEEPGELDVLEETYEVLEDDPEQSDAATDVDERKVRRPKESPEEGKPEDIEVLDEARLVYDQLNTAYCSNFEFEHERILREAGIQDDGTGAAALAGVESDDESEEARSRSVITSSNFGAANLSVSASENLPVGFFDDQNVDAKARGKLTAKEARQRIRELSRKRALYLNEAKYVQQKFLEGHRERLRMENDQVEGSEALRQLQHKLTEIKGELVLDSSDLKVDPDRDAKVEHVLGDYADLDYDDLSWMSRSLLLQIYELSTCLMLYIFE
ncbi:conserved hypothetical protein [Theileria orientalis strain Shintoku]|uniref:Uncharacterized protein n=1 Tax=Theileria orientalis strain Shintoku TaxID=869250 RepID=J4CC74_THEOR|nr:conserved hypothetical protein [Theileria orientalis strain Shintoku]PVC52690.1 hypothetical protein MACL_00000588 [Theileria orientalis]BAM38897.1 conserved hypothetical protein [Theileria orientalis strain Shintoku]|eukprot:XP_009689198.1 conserved hypothetical protein [Theileria orientalis strain Shintoku]